MQRYEILSLYNACSERDWHPGVEVFIFIHQFYLMYKYMYTFVSVRNIVLWCIFLINM